MNIVVGRRADELWAGSPVIIDTDLLRTEYPDFADRIETAVRSKISEMRINTVVSFAKYQISAPCCVDAILTFWWPF